MTGGTITESESGLAAPENRLSYLFLKQSVEDLSYSYQEGSEEPNMVRVLIRESPESLQ